MRLPGVGEERAGWSEAGRGRSVAEEIRFRELAAAAAESRKFAVRMSDGSCIRVWRVGCKVMGNCGSTGEEECSAGGEGPALAAGRSGVRGGYAECGEWGVCYRCVACVGAMVDGFGSATRETATQRCNIVAEPEAAPPRHPACEYQRGSIRVTSSVRASLGGAGRRGSRGRPRREATGACAHRWSIAREWRNARRRWAWGEARRARARGAGRRRR